MSFMKTGSWIDISKIPVSLKKTKQNAETPVSAADHFAYAIWLDSKHMP